MTVDAYINALPEPQKSILEEIRRRVKHEFPNAKEAISYGVPAFQYEKSFFFYAAFKNHVSVFPPLASDSPLNEFTKPYQNKKGNLLFPLKNPIPYDLIVDVSKALEKQYQH